MMLAAVIAAQAIVASLRVGVGDGEANMRIVEDRSSGYRLEVNCVTRCAGPMRLVVPVGDRPLGLIDLDRDGLVYSVWGTGCCYIVRVWQLTRKGAKLALETGSRSQRSLIAGSGLTIETYMRPTDAQGREFGTAVSPVRWTYRRGRFVHS
jgi:hypothetical protein